MKPEPRAVIICHQASEAIQISSQTLQTMLKNQEMGIDFDAI